MNNKETELKMTELILKLLMIQEEIKKPINCENNINKRTMPRT